MGWGNGKLIFQDALEGGAPRISLTAGATAPVFCLIYTTSLILAENHKSSDTACYEMLILLYFVLRKTKNSTLSTAPKVPGKIHSQRFFPCWCYCVLKKCNKLEWSTVDTEPGVLYVGYIVLAHLVRSAPRKMQEIIQLATFKSVLPHLLVISSLSTWL